ncbi:MAG: phosphoglycerate mutase family protein [Dysgonamonadaceae bacterium]|jgi:RecG-like helicase|nr:phosphoglycerate mutase family protein [Dysgonamonadaceae bacterium]
MENLESISKKNLEKAFEIIAELKIKEIWEKLDSTCNLVGSVNSGLLMDKLDIDFHTYSNDFSIEKSFTAISQISQNPKIKEITYRNLLNAEDMCLEWHLWYEEIPERIWTIDIMHIKNESAYAGVIERVTEKIKSVLTEKQRQAILKIKWDCKQQKETARGIDIYQAVIGAGIETFEDFKSWNRNKKEVAISLWEPDVEIKE